MVIFVRYSLLNPEDASRTVHGCAALLGLQLESDIPRNTLIVTGLRKTAEKKFLQNSFSEFGDIVGVAVAQKQRGFGECFLTLIFIHQTCSQLINSLILLSHFEHIVMIGLVRYQSSKSVQRALDKFNKEEIVVQDVGVMIKVLESETPVIEKSNNPRQLSTSMHSSMNTSLSKFDSRDTIGYPDGSIGGGRFDSNMSSDKKYRQYALDIGSDNGSRSSKKSSHRRMASGGASTTSGSSGGRNSTRRRKMSRDALILS